MASELNRDLDNLNQDWPMILYKPEQRALLCGNYSTARKRNKIIEMLIKFTKQNELINLNVYIC